MQGKREDRISELIRLELGKVMATRLRDPRIGFVTITRVEVSPDMQHAKVFYSVMTNVKQGENTSHQVSEREQTQTALEHARGFLQREIATTVNLRYTPHLDFYYDESLNHSLEIDQILKKIHQEEKKDLSNNEPD
ncbi:MAG: ribosome-binding factor A [Candidatus Omnitrophica bacterium CG11_big_fil_rev_8_21_14_0_20_45_26]|uniref:Ribosome-binding factor A n=1 Tax=Candidatus Abzuiibacterium crystallinum TaxID=1974748 RepID=A0A2H0LPL2_9BACT|nr:MAG: ribosome-binding factor A [Candidatus Omnitrophica bacterium CG11_big_fil_rev_8_21_14_0_20_45_26]PIW64367.1 MAG: ribosome-binding factor A [Candidatus Omnitrophica bacterium CG12_big_fil_rev_8_21_14_0_65_45_16]